MNLTDKKRYQELVKLYGINHANEMFLRRFKKNQPKASTPKEIEANIRLQARRHKRNKAFLRNIQNTKKYQKKKEWKIRIDTLAKDLNRVVPKSEVWFRSLFENQKLKQNDEFYNHVYKKAYIADVINYDLKYLIEIDGGIHDRSDVKRKDKKRDEYFAYQGFKTYRIKAYDNKQYIKIMKLIYKVHRQKELTEEFNNFVKQNCL